MEMKPRLSCLLLATAFFLSQALTSPAQIKVACVGDSITAGAGIPDPTTEGYPAVLGQLLGAGFTVRNYGHSGATLLKQGDLPYWITTEYTDSTSWNPNIVVIMLGSNDSKSQNWQYQTNFDGDYTALIAHYATLPSRPLVFVCTVCPVYGAGAYGITSTVVQNGVIPAILRVAQENGTPIIDINTAMSGHPEWFPDTVHPNAAGAAQMAQTVFQALPRLVPTQTPSPAIIGRGQVLTYTISVPNFGPDATNVVLTDELPSTVAYQSAVASQGACNNNSGVVTCTLGTLTNGGLAEVEITVTPLIDQSITNAVSVNWDSGGAESVTSSLVSDVSFLLQQPQSRTVRLKTLSEVASTNVAFAVSAVSGSPIRYQWSFNGTNIDDATNSSYVLTQVSLTNNGVYQALVSDSIGSVFSQPANLKILVAPTITQPLPSRPTTVLQGGSVTYTVSVMGFPPPFGYSWRRVSSILSNSIVEAPTFTLTLNNLQPSNSGLYRVVITNSASLSNTVPANSTNTLIVLADTDLDGVPDVWMTNYFGHPTGLAADRSRAQDDSDGDGMTNLAEYLAGTDPTNAQSVLRFGSIVPRAMAGVRFFWASASNKVYAVERESGLGQGFTNLSVHLPATPPTNVLEDTTVRNGATFFYRIRVE